MKVQQYLVLLNLHGDPALQLPKLVTPAEIAVLRVVHGTKDAVARGYRLGTLEVDPEDEYERLVATYGAEAVASANVRVDNVCMPVSRGLVILSGRETVEGDGLLTEAPTEDTENLGDALDRAAA